MKELDIILKALADTNRLRIIKLLEKRRMCVCELAHVLGVSQPAVSKHMKKLLKAGFIGSEQDGFWTNYFISPGNAYAKKLLRLLNGSLNGKRTVLDDLKKAGSADRKRLCCRRG
jgi:ArsR family transcriptional regulator, arsenate/arsenite/antimonite-responsive transcriptional repressor